MLSVLLRYTDSDCPFGIFKLFLEQMTNSDISKQIHVSVTGLSLFSRESVGLFLKRRDMLVFDVNYIDTEATTASFNFLVKKISVSKNDF